MWKHGKDRLAGVLWLSWFGCEVCTLLKYRHELLCNWQVCKEDVLTGEIRASTEKYWVTGWQCDFPQFKTSIISVTRFVVMSISIFFRRRQLMFHKGDAVSVIIESTKIPMFFLKSQNSVLAVNSCFGWKITLETIHGSVSNSLKDETANEFPSSEDYNTLGWVTSVIHLQKELIKVALT